MEKIRTTFRVFYKSAITCYLLASYFFVSALIVLFNSNPINRKKKLVKNAQRYCGRFLKLCNITVHVNNLPNSDFHGLIVGNHMGLIDIFSLYYYTPSLFVTSQEMRETPLLGQATAMAACIFVDRKSRKKILHDLKQLVTNLQEGHRVLVFPEATSHNAEEILPFKRTLLTSAVHAKVPIIPFCFNFVSINNEDFTMKWRDHVCYYGGIPFHHAALRIFSLKNLVCRIDFLEPIQVQENQHRAELAESIRNMIVEKFQPVKTTQAE